MSVFFFGVDHLSFRHSTHQSILDLLNEVEQKHDLVSKQAADFFLNLALQSSESKFEALLARSLRAIRASRWAEASLDLASALRIFPKHEQTLALLSKTVGSCDPRLALPLIDTLLNDFPDSKMMWPLYWMYARGLREPQYALEALERLPDVISGTELLTIYQLLLSQDNAQQQLGVCKYDPETLTVTGWAFDSRHPQRACELRIESGAVSGALIADSSSDLLKAAGLSSTVGGFQIKLVKPLECLHLRFKDGTPLLGSPLAAVESLTIDSKTNISINTSGAQWRPEPDTAMVSHKACVSVLIPVYGGRTKTLECLQSVLDAIPHNRVTHEIVVLDDASPDAELVTSLINLATQGKITLVRRPANLGFIRNMNRGMLLHQDRDVVWLNADTRVTGDWLDRLQEVAYSDSAVASVTPLSNNGELTSFPQMRESSPMPSASEQKVLDQLMSKLKLPPEALFVGCGFCLYVKRSALDDVGLLDERALSRGYGEETEWCLRAHGRGWRHAAAVNVFVAHSGGESFGRAKRTLVARNNAVIKRRYPLASAEFDRFVEADHLHLARDTIQRERMRKFTFANKNKLELVIERKRDESILGVQSLSWSFDSERKKIDPKVSGHSSICLTWMQVGVELSVELKVSHTCPAIVLNYRLPQVLDDLNRDLGTLAPSRYRILDAAGMPDMLALCLKTLKGIQPSKTIESAQQTKSSVLTSGSKQPVTKQNDEFAPELNSLGLIVDDLSDPVIATQWMSLIAERSQHPAHPLSTGMMKLLVLQDTPAVTQLEKSGVVVLANFPKGLSVERWLTLFGVSHLVSCLQQEGAILTDAFERFLYPLQEGHSFEKLPRLSAQSWFKSLNALNALSRSAKRTSPHSASQEVA